MAAFFNPHRTIKKGLQQQHLAPLFPTPLTWGQFQTCWMQVGLIPLTELEKGKGGGGRGFMKVVVRTFEACVKAGILLA